MTCEELLEKYQAVLLENGRLKEEIDNLNTKLGVSEHRAIPVGRLDNTSLNSECTINGLTDMPRLVIKQKARVLKKSQSM